MMRAQLEKVDEQAGVTDPAISPEIEAIDQTLTRMGFPKPNPMLAEG